MTYYDDEEYYDEDDDALPASAWFELLCFACAGLVVVLLGLALWDLLR